jgi:hypothetical protein
LGQQIEVIHLLLQKPGSVQKVDVAAPRQAASNCAIAPQLDVSHHEQVGELQAVMDRRTPIFGRRY